MCCLVFSWRGTDLTTLPLLVEGPWLLHLGLPFPEERDSTGKVTAWSWFTQSTSASGRVVLVRCRLSRANISSRQCPQYEHVSLHTWW
jgi:hypothetical protein